MKNVNEIQMIQETAKQNEKEAIQIIKCLIWSLIFSIVLTSLYSAPLVTFLVWWMYINFLLVLITITKEKIIKPWFNKLLK